MVYMIFASDIMTSNPFCLHVDDTIQQAAVELKKRKIDGAPVINEEGFLVGIFTKGHLMDAIARDISSKTRVEELMTNKVKTAAINSSIGEIWDTNIGRMPILDEAGNLCGIITRTDIVKALIQENRRSRDQLKVVLQSTYNPIIAVDNEEIVTIWNTAAENITGILEDEAVGRSVKELIPDTGLIDTLNSGDYVSGKKIQIGTITAISNRTPILKDSKIVGAVAVLQDITDIEAIASELQASRKLNNELYDKLKIILESAYNGIVAVDSKGIISNWNHSSERIIGIPAQKAIGKFITEVVPNTGLLDVLRTGKCSYGIKIQFDDVSAITNRTPIIKNNRIIGAVAVMQDISDLEAIASELKASRELNKELDAIIDSVYDGLYITDGQGYTTRINKSYTRMTGIDEEEVKGRHMQELVEAGYYSQSVSLIVLEKKQAVTILHTIKGTKRYLITGNPVFDDKNEIIRIVTTVRDITDLIDLKERLEKSEELTRKYHSELEHLRQQQMGKSDVIGQSKEILQTLELAQRAAQVDANVLVLGETGVGKEVISKVIHKNSLRKKAPFIKVNCAAIPESLLESELFGYEKGAFTGAQNNGKPGMFELANTGTILLDEIGELPVNIQAKLLRVLQEKEVTRIGGTVSKKLDVRIIAATNKNIEQQVQKGLFREDLYYRLNVIPIYVPALRMRKQDIPLLAKFFLDYFNKKYTCNKKLTLSAMEILNQYSWPGNIRELKNLIERLVVIINDDIITAQHLNGLINKLNSAPSDYLLGENVSLEEAVSSLEKQLIIKTLTEHRSTRKAAKILKVSQPTVVRKAKKYGIKIPK